jgi:hypothetical protein
VHWTSINTKRAGIAFSFVIDMQSPAAQFKFFDYQISITTPWAYSQTGTAVTALIGIGDTQYVHQLWRNRHNAVYQALPLVIMHNRSGHLVTQLRNASHNATPLSKAKGSLTGNTYLEK